MDFLGNYGRTTDAARLGREQMAEELRKRMTPENLAATGMLGAEFTQAGDMLEMQRGINRIKESPLVSWDTMQGVGETLTGGLSALIPILGMAKPAGDVSRALGKRIDRAIEPPRLGSAMKTPDTPVPVNANDPFDLQRMLNIKAEQMAIKDPSKRVQPSGEQMFDVTPQGYRTGQPPMPAEAPPMPRLPEGMKYNRGNRAGILAAQTKPIAKLIAERSRPFLEQHQQFFYHMGPILTKARELKIPEKEIQEWLKDFSKHYAAMSPRTKTHPNLLNASLITAKKHFGIKFDEIVGPGKGGLNEIGYPMMIGKKEPGVRGAGQHRGMMESIEGGGINPNLNTKPATFEQNFLGNLGGATADTHAIRGAILAMNDLKPGSVPIEYIAGKTGKLTAEYKAAYKADPSSLKASMIDDSIATQKVGGEAWQAEYAVFNDIYAQVGKELGVSPAEAQALAWFSGGDLTNLGSEAKSLVQLVNDRLDVTSQLVGESKDAVFRKFMGQSIPLLGIGAGVGATSLLGSGQQQDQPRLGQTY